MNKLDDENRSVMPYGMTEMNKQGDGNENQSSEPMRKQENKAFGATPSLTRVWTLDDITGETAPDGNIAPPVLPPPRPQHQNAQCAETDPAGRLWEALAAQAILVPEAVSGTQMFSV
ncbi:hypothetical protein EYF80_043773 [Liparis tanakae]|uniref:Uncharacterized protein n=1 Tax=Liparis tanakae TaxID=230148 RepID=A0A4Z2FXN7_9TELE|nr:hypothetical protein EYF80_043773 [Liparis tanakae]